jgi:disulfide bond formation protein DsbB
MTVKPIDPPESELHRDLNNSSAHETHDKSRFSGQMDRVRYQLQAHPTRALVVMGLIPVALLMVGLYLQHVVGLVPCPMCIVQRYLMVMVAITAFLLAAFRSARVQAVAYALLAIESFAGAYVAAMQSWLQWYPPDVVMCGRDFYGMIETFPLKRAIPMIFKGGGDCSVVDWMLLGGSVANWSFVAFVGMALMSLLCFIIVIQGVKVKPVAP